MHMPVGHFLMWNESTDKGLHEEVQNNIGLKGLRTFIKLTLR